MKATVLVRPKPGILDPQGKAVEASLRHLGFAVDDARIGRLVDLEVEASDPEQARAEVERMCAELLANPLDRELRDRAQRGRVTRPRIAILAFPGSNDERDAELALQNLGADPVLVWHADEELPDVGAVVLPGGFSYGDYLRAGAIARFSPAMRAVADFAADGGFVLGICNGFQVLCEAGLLPGALRPNESLSFVCRDVALRVERADVPFLAGCEVGQRLTIPVKHGEGCYFADAELLAQLQADGQIVLRYDSDNPNGSMDDIAGCRQRRRERDGAHATSRACGRPAARLRGRRADPERSRRACSRAPARSGLAAGSMSTSASRLRPPWLRGRASPRAAGSRQGH